jgi:hypothetical protein
MVLMLTEKNRHKRPLFQNGIFYSEAPRTALKLPLWGRQPYLRGQPFPQIADELLEGFLH